MESRQSRQPGFLAGFASPLRAVGFILAHPSVWPWCIAPIAINVAVVAGVWWWSGHLAQDWIAPLQAKQSWLWHVLGFLASVLAIALRVIVALVTFIVIGNVASTPFNDFLSERTDRILWEQVDTPETGMVIRAGRTVFLLLQEIRRMLLFVVVSLLLVFASLSGALAPFAAVMQFIVTAWFLALDYLAYPLERRGIYLQRQKREFVHARLSTCFGFGIAMTFICMIPFVNFLFIPLGVVGATLLHGRMPAHEQ